MPEPHENRYHRASCLFVLANARGKDPWRAASERRLGRNDDIAQQRADQRKDNAKVYDGSANRTGLRTPRISGHGGRCKSQCHLLARA